MFEPSTPSGLRGDYAAMAPDFTVEQAWSGYTAQEHDRWRRLYRRQSALAAAHASPAFLKALAAVDCGEAIPRLDKVSAILRRASGWELAAVPGLIPDDAFFTHLAARRFPVTRWIRREAELDYIVEPDLFHDFYGHVPMLFEPTFADAMQAYGARGLELDAAGRMRLARLYWYGVEFGLERRPEGFKAFGAGILSSAVETVYAVGDPRPHRIGFNLARILRTRYRIDDLQAVYFVLDRFEDLLRAVDQPLKPLIVAAERMADLEPHDLAPGDHVLTRGGGGRHHCA